MDHLDISAVPAPAPETLGALLAGDRHASGCWCTWFITSVKTYHATDEAGRRAVLSGIDDGYPLGLMARRDGEAVGWCAVGPRSRYRRAILTPTYRTRTPAEDASVWLIACLFVRPDRRGQGLSAALVGAAIAHARQSGAAAVEAFPLTSDRRQSGDTQVGFEATFANAGFAVIDRPSSNRVLMRLG